MKSAFAFPRLAAALAACALSLAYATSAVAVTEIQWWHAMTGANNDRVNNLAKRFNESQSEYKVNAGLQGQLSGGDGRGDRRLPRGQRAAHPAGVRSRHRRR